jgi:hypothetical protein
VEPIILAIAIAGFLILGVALTGIKLVESGSRWLGLAFLGLLMALLSGRVIPAMTSGTFLKNFTLASEQALEKVTVSKMRPGWYSRLSRIDPAYAASGYLPISPADRATGSQTIPDRALMPSTPPVIPAPVRSPAAASPNPPANSPAVAAPSPAPVMAEPAPPINPVRYPTAPNSQRDPISNQRDPISNQRDPISNQRDPIKGLW